MTVDSILLAIKMLSLSTDQCNICSLQCCPNGFLFTQSMFFLRLLHCIKWMNFDRLFVLIKSIQVENGRQRKKKSAAIYGQKLNWIFGNNGKNITLVNHVPCISYIYAQNESAKIKMASWLRSEQLECTQANHLYFFHFSTASFPLLFFFLQFLAIKFSACYRFAIVINIDNFLNFIASNYANRLFANNNGYSKDSVCLSTCTIISSRALFLVCTL